MSNHFDVAVIGGGPGGYVAAIACAQRGLNTVLVEKDTLGGTCLNRGCIPTKALLHSAQLYEQIRGAAEFGVCAESVSFDYEKVAARKDLVVSRLVKGVEGLVKGNQVTFLPGEASFSDSHTLNISGTKEQITFDKAILATGSVPAALPIEGADLPGVMNSDGFLKLTALPSSAVIIGGGVIGVEFASLLRSFGVTVSVVEMAPEILAGIDPDIARDMRRILQKKGVDFYLNARVQRILPGLDVQFEQDGVSKNVSGEIVILAAGRKPASTGMGLETIGVKMERGFVQVDAYCKTSVPHIYAIGDINGRAMLAHAASHQGVVAARNCCGEAVRADFSLIPSCIYTDPEIACVGITQTQAEQKGLEINVSKFQAAGNGKSIVLAKDQGYAKLVSDSRTGELLGVQLMCAHATDIIGEGVMSIKLESTVEELAAAIHPHPTISEMLMEAAHAAQGHCAHQIIRRSNK